MKGLDQTGGADNSVEVSREILRSDVERIMTEEVDKEEESKSFRRDFDVGDLSTDDLEFYMRFKDKKLDMDDILGRQERFKKVSGSPSQMQLLFYIAKNFKS